MKFLRSVPLFLLLSVLAVGTGGSGCGHLAPGGVYAGDRVLYEADSTVVSAYEIFKEFVGWEKTNRDDLWKLSPDIKHAADNIRTNGPQWIDSAIRMREVYKSKPGPDTRTALTAALGVLQQGVIEAVKYSVQYNKPG
jgi:hypothetical protein